MEPHAIVSNLHDAPTQEMRWGRGTQIKMFSPETGAVNADMHVNVINIDSGPGPYHYHERCENYYLVLEGIVEVVVEGKRWYLGKDDIAYVPPGIHHYAGTHPSSPVPARVVEVYSPPGPDFHIVEDPEEIVDQNKLEDVQGR